MAEQREVFRALVGSHNYNLNTEGSDKDYKVFVLPTFDDLYHNRMYSHSVIGEEVDLDIHDVRKMTDLWYKSNINFLEVLFSSDIEFNVKAVSMATHYDLLEIFSYREELARINLPYLYSACIGMHKQKRNSVLKGTESTQVLVEQFGFDTKQAQHSIRVLNFLDRYEQTGFEDFRAAIKYEATDGDRQYLMDLRQGKISLENYYHYADSYLARIMESCETVYKAKEPNQKLYDWLTQKIKNIVKNELR